MKHNRFHKIFSVTMALLVLVSTLSVSVGKHYCGDHLVDVAIFAQAEKCGMEVDDMPLAVSGEESMRMAKTCCKDVVDLFEGQDELSVEKTKELNTNQKVFVMVFAAVFSGLNLLELENPASFDHYSPPLVDKDLQVLHQVFII